MMSKLHNQSPRRSRFARYRTVLGFATPSRWILSLVFVVSLFVLFIPKITFANGGDQRVVEGKYLINLSRSPFTPKAGENVAIIASFVNIQKDKLIAEDLIVKVRIAKLGEGRDKRQFLFEKENLIAKGGILEFQHTFNEIGLHEIFFDFAFASNSKKTYNAPDFLLDIQKANIPKPSGLPFPSGLVIGALLGFITGWFLKRQKMNRFHSE